MGYYEDAQQAEYGGSMSRQWDEDLAAKYANYIGTLNIGADPTYATAPLPGGYPGTDIGGQGGQGGAGGQGGYGAGYDPGLFEAITGKYQGGYAPTMGGQQGGLSDAIASVQQQQAIQPQQQPTRQTPQGDPITSVQKYGPPPQNFDSEAYLRANPDVAAAGMDPWYHWNRYGQMEGRSTGTEGQGTQQQYQQQYQQPAAPKPQIAQQDYPDIYQSRIQKYNEILNRTDLTDEQRRIYEQRRAKEQENLKSSTGTAGYNVDPNHWGYMDIPAQGMAKDFIDWMLQQEGAPEVTGGWEKLKPILKGAAPGLLMGGPLGGLIGTVGGAIKAMSKMGQDKEAITQYVQQQLSGIYPPEVIQSLLDEFFLPPGGQGGDSMWSTGPGNKFFDYTLNYLGDIDGNQGNYWESDSEQSPPWGWDDTQQLWVDSEGNQTEPPGIGELLSGQDLGQYGEGWGGGGYSNAWAGGMNFPNVYSTPMWQASKQSAEDQYDIARRKIMETMPVGGPLYENLTQLDLNKASTLTGEHGRIGQDFYNKQFQNDQLMKQLSSAYDIAELGGNINLQLGQMNASAQASQLAQEMAAQQQRYDYMDEQAQREQWQQIGMWGADFLFGNDGVLGGLFDW